MKLYTLCKSCREEVKIESKASTRPELEMEKGNEFEVNCTSCGTMQQKRVNDIKAKQNYMLLLVGALISFIVTIALWNILGAIGAITFGVPLIIWNQQSNSVQAFNAYRIRR